MISFSFLCFCLTAGLAAPSSLDILDKYLDCSLEGLNDCKIRNCSDKDKVARIHAPTGPEWNLEHVEVGMSKKEPVMYVAWKIKADASISALCGSQINIVDENTNTSMCVQFSYNVTQVLKPGYTMWNFSLAVGAEPRHSYTVTVFNFPEPVSGHYRIKKQIAIPGESLSDYYNDYMISL
ncbi:interleukin-17 receptor A [Odontesthes bonariensis]|uniref:interleukin-17 receptor A n=1 Tax=Odontesthes bonariensis TaxID=219752 RepID=UPI003F58EEB7